VNAAFLLVTSAWLAGQAAPAPAAPAPTSPPAHVVSSSACCDTGCDSCCGGGLFARLRALFQRHDDCCDSCAPKCAPAPVHKDCCATTSCCDECEHGGLFARLRSWFHRNDCCDSCGTDCCGTAGAHAAPGPEPIKAPKSSEPPKAMPKGSTTGAILPQPVLAPATTLIIDR
jgi:hypothetical protein